MKQLLATFLALLIAAIGALAWTFRPATLPVEELADMQIPALNPPPQMKLFVLHTGKMFSRAAFAYRGGAFGEERVFGMAAVLVQHPQGALLIDSGFGRNVDAHVRTIPALMRATSRYEKETPAAEQLARAGFDLAQLKGVVITHAHWDHVSGLDDLRDVLVWLTQAELDFIASGDRAAALAASLVTRNYRVYGFADGPYLAYDKSYDVFRDGSVVLVPAPGHTPGSIIAFVTLPTGKRYAFVGDLVWQREGVELPAERPWLSRRLVDHDEDSVRREVARLHRLAERNPDLVIVPAHDRRVLETLPAFGS
jgi:glyoxylase-like metal-dependent hydrolase (beta-lactamase superfamily II)